MILYRNTTELRPECRRIKRDMKKRLRVGNWYAYHFWFDAKGVQGRPKRWGSCIKIYEVTFYIRLQKVNIRKLADEYNRKYRDTNLRFVFHWDHEDLEGYFSKRFKNVLMDSGYHFPLYDADPKKAIKVDSHTHVGKKRAIIWCHYTPAYLASLIRKKIKSLGEYSILANYSCNSCGIGALVFEGNRWQ